MLKIINITVLFIEKICLYTGFNDGYAVAYDSKTLKMGVVDKDLNTIIPFKYKRLTPISENRTFGYDGKILYLLDSWHFFLWVV